MDITALAASVTTALVPAMPYLVKGGEKLAEITAERLGSAAFEQAKALWERLRGPVEVNAAASELAQDLAEDPDDGDTQAALRRQLKKMLGADAELMQQLAALLGAGGRKAEYHAELHGDGAIAQEEGAVTAGKGGIAVAGDTGNIVIAGAGATVVVGRAEPPMSAVNRESALGRYLLHVTSRNRYLQLQGIRSRGKLVHIELDRIYIRLRATRQRLVEAEEEWLAGEAGRAPGERGREARGAAVETVTVSIEEALAANPRLVVLGDPGSGKTTLLRYLTLPYARDLAEGGHRVRERLGLEESGRLPVFLPLRQIGAFLRNAADDGTEGHARLLEFLHRSLAQERIRLPDDFFGDWLNRGRAVILLDGLDEVADPDLRRRVARLVERFVRAYPDCRYLVTSRIVGYTGSARLGESFVTTRVRDFTLADVKQFLDNWHRLVAVGQMGAGASADAYAAAQTRQLVQAVEHNERIRELAINPLMLTVIAMVHRDRVKLPDRRAELYAEAVDVLLGKWGEAKGIQEPEVLSGRTFDAGDKRLMLQAVALHMHQREIKEIDAEDLRELLEGLFRGILGDQGAAVRAARRFIDVVRERTGLLVARGEGIYGFSHLTFQEYLAALALAARDSYLRDTLAHAADPWWREVILLEAGHLSTQSRERASRLVRTIAGQRDSEDPYHHLVLAAECLRDLGDGRVEGGLKQEVMGRLRKGLETPPPLYIRWLKSLGAKGWIEQRVRAMEALARAGEGFWRPPHGEPEWVEIPAGEFWMGSEGSKQAYPEEQPVHGLTLPAYRIARAPVTNAQYQLFVKAAGYAPPEHWEEARPPKGLEGHPVVRVSFRDALAYCEWLGRETGQTIGLPSEAEWEKAARGDKDRREYPWGDGSAATRCNSSVLKLGNTTPVGIFPDGASPFGCLDMAGNVWEWTRSRWGEYPYPADEPGRMEREDLSVDNRRVLRGGSFATHPGYVRCASRNYNVPGFRPDLVGFRVVVSPFSD